MRVAVAAAVTDRARDDERLWRLGQLARGLAGRGHEVTWYGARWWEGHLDEAVVEDVTYRAVADDPDERGFAWQLARQLRADAPDVVHAAHDRPGHVLGARTGARFAGAPLLADWYGVEAIEAGDAVLAGPRAGLRRRLRRRAAHAGRRVVVPSRMVQTAVRELGVPFERIAVVPNGIEYDLVREVAPGDAGDIVYSRALDEDANLESLLLALAELRERGWTATVVGDGPARSRYEQQAGDLRIDDRVEFVGRLGVEDRIALFKDAHVYAQTATRSPFPTDLARALACGCVGVVEYHEASSAHELVEREDRGLLVTDDRELVECLHEAGELEHRTLDEGFEQYALEHVLDRYRDLYGEVGAGDAALRRS